MAFSTQPLFNHTHYSPPLHQLKKNKPVVSQNDYSSGDEAQSLIPEASPQEDYSLVSVIIPFVFPALGGLLLGYDIGATSGATISLTSAELSGTTWFNLTAWSCGRRRELIIAAKLYLLGGLITGCAPGLGVLLVGRVLYGIGIGMAMHGAPLYIAETCPSQIRGTLVSLKELFIVLGILLGYLVGSFQIDAIGGWRYMYGISAPIALLMGIGMWILPPSPRWLLLRAAQGKGSVKEYKEKAVLALSKLRGRPPGDKVSEKQIEETFVTLKSAYADEESEGSLMEVFQGPSLKAFIIAGGLVLFQQFVMTGVAVLKVDDLGRRPLLILGVSGLALSLFLLSAYYKFLGGFPLVAVASLLLYVGCYQEALGADNLFLFFGAIALISLLFVVLIVPETKGLSLEEIESKLLK
ncbi:hypothetical protein ACLB2K_031140 [Fragaria x ananassa]